MESIEIRKDGTVYGDGKLKKTWVDNNGYVRIYFKEGQKIYYLHRVIAKAFVPNPKNLPQVNHLNGNKEDNRAENLEWCDCSHNIKHAYDNGLYNKKLKNIRKLTNEQVREIKEKYIPNEYSYRKLSKEYKVAHMTISEIIKNNLYKIEV